MGMKLTIGGKCSDMCHSKLTTEDGGVDYEKDGYVPKGLGVGGGDYIEFEVDLETGQILNWKKPTDEAIHDFIEKSEYQTNHTSGWDGQN